MRTRRCAHCRRPLAEHVRSDAKFCSFNCRRARYRRRQRTARALAQLRRCETCGCRIVLVQKRRDTRFCSPACRQRAYRKRKAAAEKPCLLCLDFGYRFGPLLSLREFVVSGGDFGGPVSAVRNPVPDGQGSTGFCRTRSQDLAELAKAVIAGLRYCCGFNPSASNCRLHSAGASRSRSILMPRGRRPSTAVVRHRPWLTALLARRPTLLGRADEVIE
jgi:hypothetical protein